ncbi:MAG: hypothetical protein KatS3mg031_2333 [Chitinophagales bacterium]|nr:MAG: hypothetical protein KatS3mg031_2333 [Chitinophagales bacterium]
MRSEKSRIRSKERRMIRHLIEDHLREDQERSQLKTLLQQIVLLCRLFDKKVEITYETDTQEIKTIVTRVWLTTSKSIILKEGLSIPARNVKQVKVL